MKRAAIRRSWLCTHSSILLLFPVVCLALYLYAASPSSSTASTEAGLSSSSRSSRSSSGGSSNSSGSSGDGGGDATLSAPLLGLHKPTDCPAWIAEYAAFHKQHRGQPGAKYLVYSACPSYSGLGDRVRGMMYLARQAAASGRVVLFTWRNEPHEVERFLPPAGDIDWTLAGIDYDRPDLSSFCGRNASAADLQALIKGTGRYKGKSSVALRLTDYKPADLPAREFFTRGGLARLDRYRVITVHTNVRLQNSCEGCPPVSEPAPVNGTDEEGKLDVSAACLYHSLFGPSAEVTQAAQQQLVQLYGQQALKPGFQYVAVHLRLGGMANEAALEKNKGSDRDSLTDLMQAVTCVKHRGSKLGIDSSKVPVLLFTDHHGLRKFVLQGGLQGVVTTDVTPTHIARMDTQQARGSQAALSTYLDTALLAGARCAVYSNSGFSRSAWMMGGGTDCYEHLSTGLDGCLAEAQ